jgi:phage-related minor tail protein
MNLSGLPGRATGGPVSPGRAYVVGERGPELFVSSAAGQVAVPGPARPSEVRITVNVNAPAGGDQARALERSGRQVARAVRRAMKS